MDFIVLIHIGIAIWLYKYFARNDKGSKEPPKALRVAAYFGIGAVILAGFLNDIFVTGMLGLDIEAEFGQETMGTLVASALTVGVIEEVLKFVPLAFYIYKKGFFNELTDGIVYFGLAGIWFGAVESITYALIYGGNVGLLRAITIPFLHAGFSAFAGYGLARSKFITKRTGTIFVWLGLAIFLHAFYDVLLFYGSGLTSLAALVVAIIINLGLFKLYKFSQEGDEDRGMSAEGINKFCRKCGSPNPDQNLFCVSCGNKT